VRAPSRVDVDTLLTTRGPVEARRDLEIRVIGDPRDVASRLALAALDERLHRPSEAIEVLEAVVALGGPLGVRWHADDRARFARLIAERGRARLARGAATALVDLERARRLGAAITDDELRRARVAGAIAALRHSDAEVRDGGRRTLAALAAPPPGGPGTQGGPGTPGTPGTPGIHDAVDDWLGAKAGAAPEQRGRFGAWLWDQGARRAAWDELSAWHAATHPPRDQGLQDSYLTAARWWTPLDRPGPTTDELVGPARCAFVGCVPHEIVGENLLERAYLVAPLPPPVRDPADAAALAVITLHQALRGEVSWGAALAARVDLTAFVDPKQFAKLPRYAQPIFARLVGRSAPIPSEGATPGQRLVIAAEHVLAGAGVAEIAPLIGTAPYAEELRRIVTTRAPFTGDARAEAAVRHASLAVRDTARDGELRAIAVAYARDPVIADRLGRDAVAGATDAAAMHATLAALFDALGDPARARAAWQAAIDASAEPAFVRGLAEAQARQGDPDAALITATTAAAASGDPAIVWTSIAIALAGAGKYAHALDAARSAIDLSGPETLVAALEVAISASQALGRDAQAAALAEQRARIVQSRGVPGDTDPTDAAAALDAYKQHASGSTIARMWVASRWNPRDVELRAALLGATTPDDARHAVIAGELVDLAGDRDPALRRAAVAALR
jgi:tetratricopeptide (TPR) repeat protein